MSFTTVRDALQAAWELKAIKSEAMWKQCAEKLDQAERQPAGRNATLAALMQEIKSESGKTIHPQVAEILLNDVRKLLHQ